MAVIADSMEIDTRTQRNSLASFQRILWSPDVDIGDRLSYSN